MKEIRKIQNKLGLSLLYISHDIAVIAEMTDLMAVMCAGRIVEIGKTADSLVILNMYTKMLLESTPSITGDRNSKSLEGEPSA